MGVYFISDLHLGHSNLLNWTIGRQGASMDEHDEWITDVIAETVTKRDKLYILGDVAFDIDKLPLLKKIKADMVLVRGNHDEYDLDVYLEYFSDVKGFMQYKEFWLSHAPIHPEELRGHANIHGHVHHNTIQDERYVNVCVENLPLGKPISLDKIREFQKALKLREFMERIKDD